MFFHRLVKKVGPSLKIGKKEVVMALVDMEQTAFSYGFYLLVQALFGNCYLGFDHLFWEKH